MDQKGYYLEDMFVFLSITKTWIRVFSEDSRLKQRAGHSVSQMRKWWILAILVMRVTPFVHFLSCK